MSDNVKADMWALLRPVSDFDTPLPGFPSGDAFAAWALARRGLELEDALLEALEHGNDAQQTAAMGAIRALGGECTGERRGQHYVWRVKFTSPEFDREQTIYPRTKAVRKARARPWVLAAARKAAQRREPQLWEMSAGFRAFMETIATVVAGCDSLGEDDATELMFHLAQAAAPAFRAEQHQLAIRLVMLREGWRMAEAEAFIENATPHVLRPDQAEAAGASAIVELRLP